jgi:threonine dehydrogenase-like Zn-dependent dehydrogenase
MAARIAAHKGFRVIGVDLVPERLERARARKIETIDLNEHSGNDLIEVARELTDGRGPDSVIDAVGMEAHGSRLAAALQTITGFLPDPFARKLMETAGIDRLSALYTAIQLVRRGGTISLIGVYGGEADPLPMMTLFDKQSAAHGTGERAQVGARDHAAPPGRRPTRRRRLRQPPRPARRRAASVREVPKEGRRLREGPATAVNPVRRAGGPGPTAESHV